MRFVQELASAPLRYTLLSFSLSSNLLLMVLVALCAMAACCRFTTFLIPLSANHSTSAFDRTDELGSSKSSQVFLIVRYCSALLASNRHPNLQFHGLFVHLLREAICNHNSAGSSLSYLPRPIFVYPDPMSVWRFDVDLRSGWLFKLVSEQIHL